MARIIYGDYSFIPPRLSPRMCYAAEDADFLMLSPAVSGGKSCICLSGQDEARPDDLYLFHVFCIFFFCGGEAT